MVMGKEIASISSNLHDLSLLKTISSHLRRIGVPVWEYCNPWAGFWVVRWVKGGDSGARSIGVTGGRTSCLLV
jgi:hypothetical protein